MPSLVKPTGVLQIKTYPNLSVSGFTLIEVLIALAIISIAMTAVIKASSQNIRSTAYLQDKTLALWVGQNVLAEVESGVLKSSSEVAEDQTEMLGQVLYWQLKRTNTPNKHINKVEVNVFKHEKEREDDQPILSLESYITHDAKK